jgi:GT2 family glycosyltransferase
VQGQIPSLRPARPWWGAPAPDCPARRDVGDALTVVVITRDRSAELLLSLAELGRLPRTSRIIVVHNASADGSAHAVEAAFPDVDIVRLSANMGATGRNVGAALASPPNIAFSDDDSWWAPDALDRAASILDEHPGLAVVTGRVLVGPYRELDPTCALMADSGIPLGVGVPGVPIFGFVACGAVLLDDPGFLSAESPMVESPLARRGTFPQGCRDARWLTCH